ncbi:N-6 DNA methylase [Streptacidiphilus sp. EB129]|uniref:N-6 DNA methylase n=1 Tax=Streptacidiphilus sp. EB129 TaxID=3156262 RepID=UPI0035189204
MPDHEPQQQVSAVEIARLAGVGRAAVSNWRRRHADFPKPVGGTENSPAFALPEVEAWLRAQGKIAEVPLRERVRQRLERLRDPAASPAAPLVPALALLLLLRRDPARWQSLAARDDLDLAVALPGGVAELCSEVLGPDGARLLRLPGLYGSTQLELTRLLAALAAEQGIDATAAALVGTALPASLTALLVELTGEHPTLLDPACCGGDLLLAAAEHGAVTLYGQEADPALAAVALLRLALSRPTAVPHIAAGDALRADAHSDAAPHAVLSRPPYNERNWGADELGYDPRWEYGLPPRAESELAWVQHALARVRPGGPVTLLLPGAVAARRSGRRIRAELLRRGALRGVVALPAGIAPPYAAALHIWLLRRPLPGEPLPARVLLVDAAAVDAAGTGAAAANAAGTGAAVARIAREAWAAFGASGSGPVDEPGRYRAVPVIDLLDDETDLTPARHLPQRPVDALGELEAAHRRLDALLAELAPPARPLPGYRAAAGDVAHRAASSVAELLRSGALELLPEGAEPRPGDIVLPAPGTGGSATVHEGAADDIRLPAQLLRPDQSVLDPWFLAGFLGSAARAERAGTLTSTTSRRDVRRIRVPRLSLAEQRRYAQPFRQLAAFEQRLRRIAELGEQLTQGITAGLVQGSLTPED